MKLNKIIYAPTESLVELRGCAKQFFACVSSKSEAVRFGDMNLDVFQSTLYLEIFTR